MKYIRWQFLPVSLFFVLVFFLWHGLSLNPRALPSTRLNQPLPFFDLPELNNPALRFTSRTMKGSPMMLLNVWASWCIACAEEEVFLMKLAREGVVIDGLNYQDNPQDAAHFLAVYGNPYRHIGVDTAGRAGIELGVYGAPETFLIDEKGIIRYRYAGVLNEAVWREIFLPKMRTNDVE